MIETEKEVNIWPSDSNITVLRLKTREKSSSKADLEEMNDLALLGDGLHLSETPSLVNLVTLVQKDGVFPENAQSHEAMLPVSSWDPDTPLDTPRSSSSDVGQARAKSESHLNEPNDQIHISRSKSDTSMFQSPNEKYEDKREQCMSDSDIACKSNLVKSERTNLAGSEGDITCKTASVTSEPAYLAGSEVYSPCGVISVQTETTEVTGPELDNTYEAQPEDITCKTVFVTNEPAYLSGSEVYSLCGVISVQTETTEIAVPALDNTCEAEPGQSKTLDSAEPGQSKTPDSAEPLPARYPEVDDEDDDWVTGNTKKGSTLKTALKTCFPFFFKKKTKPENDNDKKK